MTLILSPEIDAVVGQKVREGLYSSGEQVLREALLLLEKRDNYKKYLNTAIEQGLNSADKGDLIPEEEVLKFFDNLIK